MFIVIEGLDGCGKSTQVDLIKLFFEKQNIDFRHIKLPDYDSKSSALVNMYLGGEFGSNPEDVNVYAATAFYAVDRFANFSLKWKADYQAGKTILADRYTTSNAIYQTAKLPQSEWDNYLDWLKDFEYGKIGVPQPDLVIFLDMPVDISQKLMSKRYNGNEVKKDVHEKNVKFLKDCRSSALYTAEKWGWKVVNCSADGISPKSIEEVNKEIISLISEALKK